MNNKGVTKISTINDFDTNLVSFFEASRWASDYLDRKISPSQIGYLVQYARIKKYNGTSENTKVSLEELKNYYDSKIISKQDKWKKKLGNDLNWALSFDDLREYERTKHVHRLHPYKGKFIPQLVEYFLDNHIDIYKTEIFFKTGDVVLDPFMGSGTTLIQASELGLNSIGIDISEFNCLISKVKIEEQDIPNLKQNVDASLLKTKKFSKKTFDDSFDKELKDRISNFNKKYFPNPQYKHDLSAGRINEKEYSKEKANQFLSENEEFLRNNGTLDKKNLFKEDDLSSFLTKWFSKRIKQELFYYLKVIEEIQDEKTKNVMRIILSRTARSCRATTHSDLATLKKPQFGPYYCRKHKKICIPVNTIIKHLEKNTYDTIDRLVEYSKLKKNTNHAIIHGDSRIVDIFDEVKSKNLDLYNILKNSKIAGVFTSPPYVGQIDYHEQHAYAYELFEISRKDEEEIGPLFKGQGNNAREEYIEGISKVLQNISRFVKDDGNFFMVANDKYNLYPEIAKKSKLKIVNRFKRPVLNRTEKSRHPYAEIIFHMTKL